jgi:hypothetical protein
MKTFRDPEIEPFTKSKFLKYSLVGLINAPVLKIPIPNRSICLIRIPIITPNRTQCILEIACPSFENEPKFSRDWKELQLFVAYDCNYRGVTEQIGERRVHIFGLTWTRQTFIWLSPKKFWVDPIAKSDKNQIIGFSLKRCGKGEGILRYSNGSRFGQFWHRNFDLHSGDFNPYVLTDLERFYNVYNQILRNIPSGKFRKLFPEQQILFHKQFSTYGAKKIVFFSIPTRPQPEKLTPEVLAAFYATTFDDEITKNSTVILTDQNTKLNTSAAVLLDVHKVNEKTSESYSNDPNPSVSESDEKKLDQSAFEWFNKTVNDLNFQIEPVFEEVLEILPENKQKEMKIKISPKKPSFYIVNLLNIEERNSPVQEDNLTSEIIGKFTFQKNFL